MKLTCWLLQWNLNDMEEFFMPKYEFEILNISFDTAQVKADSYDEAVNEFLDGNYELVGPDGVIERYFGSGIFLGTLRVKGVSEETIERIRIEYNDEHCNEKRFFGGVNNIQEIDD